MPRSRLASYPHHYRNRNRGTAWFHNTTLAELLAVTEWPCRA
jgi:hypothetical protein